MTQCFSCKRNRPLSDCYVCGVTVCVDCKYEGLCAICIRRGVVIE